MEGTEPRPGVGCSPQSPRKPPNLIYREGVPFSKPLGVGGGTGEGWSRSSKRLPRRLLVVA